MLSSVSCGAVISPSTVLLHDAEPIISNDVVILPKGSSRPNAYGLAASAPSLMPAFLPGMMPMTVMQVAVSG